MFNFSRLNFPTLLSRHGRDTSGPIGDVQSGNVQSGAAQSGSAQSGAAQSGAAMVAGRRIGSALISTALVLGVVGVVGVGPVNTATTAAAATVTPRIDLKVLVLSDGGPATAAITSQLASEGVPHRIVDLTSSSRPTITTSFLSDTVLNGLIPIPRGKYQSVIYPNASPVELSDAEKTALATYQATFAVRGVFAYTYAAPNVGLEPAVTGGYAGTLDGAVANVTAAGQAAGFSYLDGPVPFDDTDPSVWESYGYLSAPLATQPAGASFQTLVAADMPGATNGSLVGVYDANGVENLVVTFVYRNEQLQYRLLAHGIVSWATRGIHLGYERSYLAVHVDDIFLPDARWSVDGNCTPGEDCTGGQQTSNIRMTSADADRTRAWQANLDNRFPTARNFTFDLVFNGYGVAQAQTANGGVDPLSTALLAPTARDDFRWINHTWSHKYLGCQPNYAVTPWACKTTSTGGILWETRAAINDEIRRNRTFAVSSGIAALPSSLYRATELVTGEHSGLQRLPKEPTDNPNIGPSLADTGIATVASDASREANVRSVGPAVAVPRYPLAVYFNTATATEMVDEYNWIYGSLEQGGSGFCENNSSTTTCLSQPLDPATGFGDYIVKYETRQSLGRMSNNDPRPVFVHQANLAEDALLLTMLDGVLGGYDALYADSRPLLSPQFTSVKNELVRQQEWAADRTSADLGGYVIGNRVTLFNRSFSTTKMPLTLPAGSTAGSSAFGESYAGERSSIVSVSLLSTRSYTSAMGWPQPTPAPAVPAPAPDVTGLVEPEAVTTAQPAATLLTPEMVATPSS